MVGRLAASMLDGRVKLVLLILSCFISQYLPSYLLPIWLLALGCLFIPRGRRGVTFYSMLRGGVIFILFWLVMTAGSDIVSGKGWLESILAALPLGGRLFALTLAGIAYIEYVSPIETGRAVTWFLTPLLGGMAWKPGVAVALTAWFLPQSLRLSGEISSAMRARGLRLSFWRRSVLLAGTALRILEAKAEELAVGLASRGLDDERSWRH